MVSIRLGGKYYDLLLGDFSRLHTPYKIECYISDRTRVYYMGNLSSYIYRLSRQDITLIIDSLELEAKNETFYTQQGEEANIVWVIERVIKELKK